MNHDERPRGEQPATATRKPYQRPTIDESAEFETLALTCGKTSSLSECELTGFFDS